MASITQYYKITGPVPFEDVDVHVDNRLYLDPHLIRLRADASHFANDAVHCLDTFFDTVSLAAMSSEASVRAEALHNLRQFKEPWETRLGMAQHGFSGHGGAEDIGDRIWTALTTDLEALLDVGVLKHLEHLPLFVQTVDKDITSDITTRIIFGPLADFTEMMLARYPAFDDAPHATAHFDRQVWNARTSEWSMRRMRLPIAADRPLLLLPTGWTRRNLLMSPTRFYETSLLSYVQETQAVVLSDGRVVRTPKDRLRTQTGLNRGRQTNIDVTRRAHIAGDDLVELFQDFVRERFEAAEARTAA